MGPLFWLRRQDCLARDTTYALTDRRLLMAVGPDRGQIREVALASLASVQIRYRQWYGRVLDLVSRGSAR